MGFIDWHGNKEDHYEEVVEFAKENAQWQKDKQEDIRKIRANIRLFGVPELEGVSTNEILKLIIKEKAKLDDLHAKLVKGVAFDEDIEFQFYNDFWLYWVDHLLEQGALEDEKRIQLLEAILGKAFKVKQKTSADIHLKKIRRNEEYQAYMRKGYELVSGSSTLFWQWLGYLNKQNVDKALAIQFAELFYRFLMHFSFYLNRRIIGQKIGKKLAERRDLNERIIRQSLSDSKSYVEMEKDMRNPLYIVTKEPVVETYEDKKKKFIALLKYANIIIGNCMILGGDEEDMVAAGRLYMKFKEGTLPKKSIASILPDASAYVLQQNRLPVIDADEVKVHLRKNEVLHYIENAILYRQDLYNEEEFRASEGTMFITNERLRFSVGSKEYEMALDDIAKVVLYDVLPDVLALSAKDRQLFFRTADTAQTYHFLKLIMSGAAEMEAEKTNRQKLSIEYFEHGDLEKYVFGIRTMVDAERPEQMITGMLEMADAMESLDKALKKYPAYEEQAHRFFTYYIPEMMRLVFSYNEYEKAGISESQMNPVYDKVIASIQKVRSAALQEVDDIYQMATLETMAKAEALQKIIARDGYADTENILKSE